MRPISLGAVLLIALLFQMQHNAFGQNTPGTAPAATPSSTSDQTVPQELTLVTPRPGAAPDPQKAKRLQELRRSANSARAHAAAKMPKAIPGEGSRHTYRVHHAKLLHLPESKNTESQAPHEKPLNPGFQQSLQSKARTLASTAGSSTNPLTALAPATAPQGGTAPAPLDNQLITIWTPSAQNPLFASNFFPPMFKNAMDAATIDVLPAGTKTLLGKFMVPYFVNSPNVTFRVPGYVFGNVVTGWYAPWNAPEEVTGTFPTTITLQQLEQTSTNAPVQDASDLTGYKWTDITSPLSIDRNLPNPFGYASTWMPSTFQLRSPDRRMYLTAETNVNFGDPDTKYHLDIPVGLSRIVNILRFCIVVHVNASTDVTYYSGAVPVLVGPTALVQLKSLPVAIIYQPPGDQSSVDYSQSTTSTVGLTSGFSAGTGTQWANDMSGSSSTGSQGGFSFSVPFFGSFGVKGTDTDDQTWDKRKTQTNSSTDTSTNTLTITTTVSGDWQLGGNPPAGQPYTAPYWNDTFILATHPQIALWDFMLPMQGSTNPNGVVADLLSLDLDATMSVTVKQLDACANGQDVVIPIGSGGAMPSEYLNQSDCQALLTLDPFYSAGQSDAPVNVAIQESSFNVGSPDFSDTIKLSTSLGTGGTRTKLTNYSSVIDSTQGDASKFNLTASFGGGGPTEGNGHSNSTTTGSTATLSYSNAAELSGTLASSASRTLKDTGSKGQLPIIGTAYVDSRFGTWMFVGSLPQTCFSKGQGVGCSTPCSNQTCSAPCKLAAGNASQYVCPAVGSVTGDWSATMPASAKCGDTIVINGFGLTEVNSVQFQAIDTGDAQIVVSPRSSINIRSDDVVSALLNAPGNHTYKVSVSTPQVSDPVVEGEIAVTGTCP